jgi:hypothetical protein
MKKEKSIIKKVLDKKPLNPEEVIISPIYGDGNCFYRALSLYLTMINHIIKLQEILFRKPQRKIKKILNLIFLMDYIIIY